MAFSYTIVSFIIIGMMFTLLIYVGNTVVSYITTINRFFNPIKGEYRTLTQVLIVQSANYSNGYIFLNLSNSGSSSIIIDNSSTLILEYVSNYTNRRVIEFSKFGESWFIEGYFIANNYFTHNDVFIDLRPGTTTLLKVVPSDTPSPNNPILIVFTTHKGVRAEYVFTYN
ncbi:MAG: hypothetical protein QXO98_05520 [Sulfolobales archaeon]